MKESLFNILGPEIFNISMLDLFGGTGSVGIEALSRGAKYVRFVDIHRPAAYVIKENLERTHLADKGEVVVSDAFDVLRRRPDRQFDIIYVAPPQYKELWVQAMREIDNHMGWLLDDAWVIVQIDPVEYKELDLQNLTEFEQRRYGSTLLVFYEVNPPEEIQSSVESEN